MKCTMNFVLTLAGIVLALTGIICLLAYYWEDITIRLSKGKCGCCDDFDDDLLFDFDDEDE